MNPSAATHALREAHLLIMTGGVLGVLSVLAGLASRRIGAPVLLVFLGIGMLAGDDGVLGIPFDDYGAAYLIGSVALAVILFQGGLKTPLASFRRVFWPAAALATVGVAATTFIVGGLVSVIEHVPLEGACLAGAIVAPTDAAAVSSLLRRSGAAVPERLMELLEVESGLNDPMSVFLTFTLLRLFAHTTPMTVASAAIDFGEEMIGGIVVGLCCGWAMKTILTKFPIEPALANVLALTGALAVFGLAQLAGASGFLATYLAGVVVGGLRPDMHAALDSFFDGMGWLAQILLFLMLGLLVTPHNLPPYLLAAIVGAVILILVARPVSVFACLLPFGFSVRESAFASWVGLRGAVPIYLSVIPALADPARDIRLFGVIFIVVVASLIVQGWTVGPAARLLGYGAPARPSPG
jgi:cell volume regulation protein A